MARLFDGTNDSLVSSSLIDLSGVNKITVAFWLWWDSFANDDDVAMEFSSNYNLVTTGFIIGPNESTSTRFMVALKGDVGYNQATYTRPSAAAWHHYVAIFDKSQATNEVDLYIDGVLQTPVTRPATSNNTNNFANENLFVMCRGNASLFGAGRMAHLVIYPGVVLTVGEVGALYRGGVHPMKVRHDVWAYYWQLNGKATAPEVEERTARGKGLAVNGAIPTSEPPVVIRSPLAVTLPVVPSESTLRGIPQNRTIRQPQHNWLQPQYLE